MPVCALSWFVLHRNRSGRWIEIVTSAFLLLYSAATAAIFVVFEPTIYGISGVIAEGNFVMIMLAAFTLACLRLGWALFVGTGIIVIYCYAAWQ